MIAVSVDMRHHIVPQPAFVRIGGGEIDVLDVLAQLVDLRRCNRQTQFRFRLGQPNPKLPPGAKFFVVAPQPTHLRRGVTANERVLIEFVRHDGFRSRSAGNTTKPRPFRLRLKRGDFIGMLEREPDIVQPVEQAMPPEIFDFKRQRQAEVIGQPTRFQVDSELITWMFSAALEKIVDRIVGKANRQHAVFEAVVIENIGEAGGDNHAEAVIAQCPRGMLAAGPAAEITAGQKDACASVFGPVEFEFRIVGSVVAKSPIEKQKLPKASALDALEELLGDDLIGIDIRPIHRGDEAGMFGEGGHDVEDGFSFWVIGMR